MTVAVWDTYVQREDGLTMHFDILVPQEVQDKTRIFKYADEYLAEKDFESDDVRSSRCQFCHMEEADETVLSMINQRGFDIIEFENCY